MKSKITTIVVNDEDEEKDFELVYEDNVVEFVLDGRVLFSADWKENIEDLFLTAIKSFDY